jgi:hypothetical protein
MGRPERPLDASHGPIAAFAHDLRLLRNRAGGPSYRTLARTALFSPSVLSTAASGYRLPTLAVTLAFVSACGGDGAAWERRWRNLAGTGSHDDRSAVRRSPAPPARPAQLPMGPSTFAGRADALATASRMIGLAGPTRTPLLVGGPIGIGKSAFALRLAAEVAAGFPDGLLYADLGEHGTDNRSADSVVCGFLRALGVPAPGVPDEPAQRECLYRSLLAQRRLFVLLANARDERQVRPLLGRTSHSQVVVTSRARLLGLDGVHRIDLPTFTRQDSMELIGRLAGPARVRAEYEAADAVAGLCGDLPLAVNIIGRKIAAKTEWSIAYIAGLLAESDRVMDTLSVGDVNVRDRFASAYETLSPVGRQVIGRLALNGARWMTAAEVAIQAEVAVETADELLESLVDAGLLRRDNASGRYAVSPLVGVFAADAHRDAGSAPDGRTTRKTLVESFGRDVTRVVAGARF